MSLISLHSEQADNVASEPWNFTNHFQPGMEISKNSRVALNTLSVTRSASTIDAQQGSDKQVPAVRLMFNDGADDIAPYINQGLETSILENTMSRGSYIVYLEPREYSSIVSFCAELERALNTTAHPSLYQNLTVSPITTNGDITSIVVAAVQDLTFFSTPPAQEVVMVTPAGEGTYDEATNQGTVTKTSATPGYFTAFSMGNGIANVEGSQATAEYVRGATGNGGAEFTYSLKRWGQPGTSFWDVAFANKALSTQARTGTDPVPGDDLPLFPIKTDATQVGDIFLMPISAGNLGARMCLFQFCMTEVGFQPRLLAHGFGDANTGTTQFPTELWSSLLSTDYDGETNVRMAFKLRGNRVVAALGFGLAIPADIELDGTGGTGAAPVCVLDDALFPIQAQWSNLVQGNLFQRLRTSHVQPDNVKVEAFTQDPAEFSLFSEGGWMCPHALFNWEQTKAAPTFDQVVDGAIIPFPSPEVDVSLTEGVKRNVFVVFGAMSLYNPNVDTVSPSLPNFQNALANCMSLYGVPSTSVKLESTGIPLFATQNGSWDPATVFWNPSNKCLYVRVGMLGNINSFNGCTSQSDTVVAVIHNFTSSTEVTQGNKSLGLQYTWEAQERMYLRMNNIAPLHPNQIRLEIVNKKGEPITSISSVDATIHII